jgi:hypothetical protein
MKEASIQTHLPEDRTYHNYLSLIKFGEEIIKDYRMLPIEEADPKYLVRTLLKSIKR